MRSKLLDLRLFHPFKRVNLGKFYPNEKFDLKCVKLTESFLTYHI